MFWMLCVPLYLQVSNYESLKAPPINDSSMLNIINKCFKSMFEFVENKFEIASLQLMKEMFCKIAFTH